MRRADWVKLTERQHLNLRKKIRRTRSAAKRRRLNAVALYDAGEAMEQIAATLGCCVGTVSLDLARWRREGFAGMAPKPGGGSEPKLSEAQLQALEGALASPPSTVGYRAGTWSLALMARFLTEQVGAPKVHFSNVGRRLLARGWRRLRPRLGIVRRDAQRKEKLAVIEEEKRGRWQRIPTP
jgi:transposase